MMALVRSVEHFHHILAGQQFTVVTDSRAVKHADTLKATS